MKLVSRFARAVIAMVVMTLHLVGPAGAAGAAQPASHPTAKPTVVLVHGAFAESASWDAVARQLRARNFPVIAAANPLRGLKADAAYVGAIVDSVPGPVVLVGHSYGGAVISAAADAKPNVKALVFVSAFAPAAGNRRSTCRRSSPAARWARRWRLRWSCRTVRRISISARTNSPTSSPRTWCEAPRA